MMYIMDTNEDERVKGEEHFRNGSKVHKYGKSTTGESSDIVVDEETYYEIIVVASRDKNERPRRLKTTTLVNT
nr:hypothetical protein CTI12_AA572080 [Tanacetum cinerariifolium]